MSAHPNGCTENKMVAVMTQDELQMQLYNCLWYANYSKLDFDKAMSEARKQYEHEQRKVAR